MALENDPITQVEVRVRRHPDDFGLLSRLLPKKALKLISFLTEKSNATFGSSYSAMAPENVKKIIEEESSDGYVAKNGHRYISTARAVRRSESNNPFQEP